MNIHLRVLLIWAFINVIITPDFAQKWRVPFRFEKEMKVAGESKHKTLENTIIVKLKPQYASLLEKSDESIINLLYPLDITNIKPLFKESNQENKHQRKNNSVNLDLIYVIQYTPSTMAMNGVLNFLSEFDYFEYCEPYYIPLPASPYIPNDTEAQPGGDQNYHLEHVQAFDAWGVEQGDPSVIIGVIDTGFDINHDDLKNNYIAGWDVADNDANVIHPTEGHGTSVAGMCSAEVDNNLGIAGSGFKCKFMPIKAASDGGNALVAGYTGIQYAAENGCKVINLSWGSIGGYSSALQDIINYAAIDYDVAVIGAAGNTDVEGDFYPAAYDNVLSVCALDTAYSSTAGKVIDIRSRFRDFVAGVAATYAHSVDIGAHGTMIISTVDGNSYAPENGSSFACPFVAGAAGILRSKYPSMTALQIIELLRVTSDDIYQYSENDPFLEKLGKGRLNMFRAVTENSSPAVRMLSFDAESKHGEYFLSKDTVTITLDLWNYLSQTDNLSIDLTSSSTDITLIDDVINVGIIDSMTGTTTTALPLKFKVNADAGHNVTVVFRLGFEDPGKSYSDYQYFQLVINPSTLDIFTSKVRSTITSNGQIGYDINGNGSGYKYNSTDLLYECGLMVGTNTQVSDCVRGNFGLVDNEFKPTSYPAYIDPAYKDIEIMNKMNDSIASSIIGVSIEQRSYAFDQTGLDQCFIVEYQITNNRATQIDALYTGLFCDWDIDDYSKNRAEFDYTKKLGYTYSSFPSRPYAGVALLTNQDPIYYAMDNGTVPDVNNINPNDGYSLSEKLKSLKSGVGRAQAGMISSGFDVSSVTGAQLYNLAAGKTYTVAFAILAADNLASLKTNTDAIKAKFIDMKTSKVPTGDTYYLCDGETKDITFTPGNGVLFNFYEEILDNTALATKSSTYTETSASTGNTIYVAGADSLYESTTRTPMYIDNSSTAKADFGISTTTVATGTPVYFFNSSDNYTSLTWDYGDGNGDNDLEIASHAYSTNNTFTVTLTAMDDKGCTSSKQENVIVSISTGIQTFPNPANNTLGFGDDIQELGNLKVVNSIGQLIYEQNNTYINASQNIAVYDWPEGVYTLIFTAEQKQYTQKILIKH